MPRAAQPADHLRKIVESFPRLTVTVLGDMVADEFVFGEISRVSREAPVLILRHRDRMIVPGGGANAANNLQILGSTFCRSGSLAMTIPAAYCCEPSVTSKFR